MIEFKPYEAKPIVRWAIQITSEHEVVKMPNKEYAYIIAEKTDNTTNIIQFKAYEEPKISDWIVRLTPEDTYHCTDAVFRDRSIVPEK